MFKVCLSFDLSFVHFCFVTFFLLCYVSMSHKDIYCCYLFKHEEQMTCFYFGWYVGEASAASIVDSISLFYWVSTKHGLSLMDPPIEPLWIPLMDPPYGPPQIST